MLVQFCGRGIEAEVEDELVRVLSTHEYALHEGCQNGIGLGRYGNADTEIASDILVLAEEDLQDDAVDAVVLAV